MTNRFAPSRLIISVKTYTCPACSASDGGPIFHRGGLVGSSRVVVIGQDPAQHERIVRQNLLAEAGLLDRGWNEVVHHLESWIHHVTIAAAGPEGKNAWAVSTITRTFQDTPSSFNTACARAREPLPRGETDLMARMSRARLRKRYSIRMERSRP